MASSTTSNINIKEIISIPTPDQIIKELPITKDIENNVVTTRKEIGDILEGKDDRLVVIVGPCSVHDTKAAIEYAHLLKDEQVRHAKELLIVMRVYFEKPRTISGWKGLINDPALDETFDINSGLKMGRKVLLEINGLGLACAVEYLDVVTPQYLSDLISYGAIGARTVESQVHRELASGISAPIGFKNSTSGNITLTANAVKAANGSHRFLGIDSRGQAAIFHSTGNKHGHIILRGGSDGPNYSREHIKETVDICLKQDITTKIMVDCSHGNSSKNHKNQPIVAADVAEQVAGGDTNIFGLMVESNLFEGNQPLTQDLAALKYGVSITDACISFQDTIPLLQNLAQAVKSRRELS